MSKDHTVAELAQLVAKAYQVWQESYVRDKAAYTKKRAQAATEAGCGDNHPLHRLVVYALFSGELCDNLAEYLEDHT